MKTLLILTALILNLSISSNLFSQYADNIRSNSMGKIAVSNSYNTDALNYNPANLSIKPSYNKSSIYFNVFSSAGFIINSNFVSYDFYKSYFIDTKPSTGKIYDNPDKDKIFASAKNTYSDFGASYKLLSFVYSRNNGTSFGASIDDRITGSAFLPEDFVSFVVYHNEAGRMYDFSNFETEITRVRQINLTYSGFANVLSGLHFGLSIKPQFGYYYFGTNKNDLSFRISRTGDIESHGSLSILTSGNYKSSRVLPPLDEYTGFGMAFDAGFNVSVSKELNFAASLTDLGWIRWFGNTTEKTYDGKYFADNISSYAGTNDLNELLEGRERKISSFTKKTSSYLHLGSTYSFFTANDKEQVANVSMEYTRELNGPESLTQSYFSAGGEIFSNRLISPRTGFITDGKTLLISAGLGLNAGPLILDVGTHNIAGLFKLKSGKSTSLGVNLKFNF